MWNLSVGASAVSGVGRTGVDFFVAVPVVENQLQLISNGGAFEFSTVGFDDNAVFFVRRFFMNDHILQKTIVFAVLTFYFDVHFPYIIEDSFGDGQGRF